MCGRYALANVSDLGNRYEVEDVVSGLKPRFNIAPTQDNPVVFFKDEVKVVDTMRWGLIPFWAKDEKIGYKMINARAETVAEKPTFRKPFKSQRCLVPATGFYEWQKTEDGKQPYFIHTTNSEIFSFAGLFDVWKNPQGENVYSYTLITTEPNDLMNKIHNRMPVILEKKEEDLWLSPDAHPNDLRGLLDAYAADEMEAYMVSKAVNSPGNDGVELAKRLKK